MKNNKESSSSSSSCPETTVSVPGCGNANGSTLSATTSDTINLNITTTTGGNFCVLVDVQITVENLKKIIAKKLKVAKDRICLLHRERELHDGILKENGLVNGSKIILIPSVETGLLAQRPENTVMQALESLNDAQVNDFLSGKTPLNLSMRLGDHMMLIQLQLSTVSPSSPPHSRSRSRSRTGRTSTSTSSSLSSSSTTLPSFNTVSCAVPCPSVNPNNRGDAIQNSHHLQHQNSTIFKTPMDTFDQTKTHLRTAPTAHSILSQNDIVASSSINSENNLTPSRDLNSFLNKHGFENLQDMVKDISQQQQSTNSENSSVASIIDNCCSTIPIPLNNLYSNSNVSTVMNQSPPKSVPIPLKSTAPEISNSSNNSNYYNDLENVYHMENESSMCSDPISAKLTSCLCKRLDGNTVNSKECETNQCQRITTDSNNMMPKMSAHSHLSSNSSSSSSFTSLLHKTFNNPIHKSKHRYSSSDCQALRKNLMSYDRKYNINNINSNNVSTETMSNGNFTQLSTPDSDEVSRPTITATDARALAEASRNLTQTLRKLSKEVFTNKVDLSDQTPCKSNSGAVIESMKNHGKGIYSGTFSGTLNPALQDEYGRPKRDISTVIHILNDLLSATPQYSRDTRISFEPPSSLTSQSRGFSNRQALKPNFTIPTEQQECKNCLNSPKVMSAAGITTTAATGANNKSSKNSTCAYGECDGHTSSTSFLCSSAITPGTKTEENKNHRVSFNSNNCHQDISMSDRNSSISSNMNLSSMCSKCSIDLENSKTKCKLDQLRLVMQQKKQKREARKLKAIPYGARMLGTATQQQICGGVSGSNLNSTDTAVAAGSATTNTAATSGGSGNSTAAATASAAASTTITSIVPPSEVSPNHIVEEVIS